MQNKFFGKDFDMTDSHTNPINVVIRLSQVVKSMWLMPLTLRHPLLPPPKSGTEFCFEVVALLFRVWNHREYLSDWWSGDMVPLLLIPVISGQLGVSFSLLLHQSPDI